MKTEYLCRRISEILGIAVFLIGCVVLVGWIFDIPDLKSISPAFVTMKANTAICFVLIGLSLWLLQEKRSVYKSARIIAGICSAAVFAIGFLTFLEYIGGWDFGIDQLIFKELATAVLTSSPGRMALNTAMSFTFLGLALLLVGNKAVFIAYCSQILALLAGMLGFLSLIGYLYRADPLIIGVYFSTAMALHTSVLFPVVSLAYLFLRPKQAFMSLISGDYYGSVAFRRIIPVIVFFPLIFGWLVVNAGFSDLLSYAFGIAILAILNMLVTGIFVYLQAVDLNVTDAKRRKSEELLIEARKLLEKQNAKLDARLKEVEEFHEITISMLDDNNRIRADLEREKNRAQSYLDVAAVMFVVIDRNQLVMLVNEETCKVLGYTEDYIVGKNWFDTFVPQETREMIRTGFNDVINGKTEQLRSSEERLLINGGQEKLIAWHNTVLRDETGAIIGTLHSGEDVTEHRKMEVALQKSEGCLSRIGYRLTSLGTDYAANVHSITMLCGELLGGSYALYNRLEKNMLCSLGQWNTPNGYMPQDKPEGHICYDVIRKGNPDIVVIRNLSDTAYAVTDSNVLKYGLKTYIGCPVFCASEAVGSIGIFFDTDVIPAENDKRVLYILASALGLEEKRRKAEEQLRRAYVELREMQNELIQSEKLAVIGQLASGISHEIRNPLGIIAQGVDFLERGLASEKRDDLEAVALIKDSVGRANKIVSSLLDFSRKSAATLDLKPEDINPILGSALDLIMTHHKFENINIIRQLDKSLPKVMVDKSRIVQVFMNIFLNAVESMPQGGDITVRTNAVKKAAVAVEIEDTGMGIPPDKIDKIFLPFFTTKAPTGGTGLGLPISRRIIDMHKALIDIKSEVGKGTTVTITFTNIAGV